MEIQLVGRGSVTLEELEARLSAYLNAGGPEPVLAGGLGERREILETVHRRGDSQMKALVDAYLSRLAEEEGDTDVPPVR